MNKFFLIKLLNLNLYEDVVVTKIFFLNNLILFMDIFY